MLNRIISLHITKENNYYKLNAILNSDQGYITLSSKISQPFLQIENTDNQECIRDNGLFKSIILNKSASFHFDADALVDTKTQSLFTLTLDKKEKTFTPKKHRKRDKKSSKR